MNPLETYKKAEEEYKKGERQRQEYMSDMKHWLCVHVTDYEPQHNAKGELYIKTTGMATDYKYPRGTIHVTLNQISSDLMYGKWNKKPVIILAPYNDVVHKNVHPQEISVSDTYFIPNPDTGLILPDSANIIKSSQKNDKLFEIGEHETTYKTGEYSAQEIKKILSFANHADKSRYQEFSDTAFTEKYIQNLLFNNDELNQQYETSQNKEKFKEQLIASEKHALLRKILRNAVVEMAMEKMGYRYIIAFQDTISERVKDIAEEAGIKGHSGLTGHWGSMEHKIEGIGYMVIKLSETLKSKNIDDIYAMLTANSDYSDPMQKYINDSIIPCILSDTSIPNVYKVFEETCKPENIKEYNPFLDTVIHRHADRMTIECNQALTELRKDSDSYGRLKEELNNRNSVEKEDLLEAMFGKTTEECEDFIQSLLAPTPNEWLRKTRANFSGIYAAQERVKNIEKTQKGTAENDEKIIEEKRAENENLYSDINPTLAQLRRKEKENVEKGMDSKTAQKERRIAVRKYYVSKIEGR